MTSFRHAALAVLSGGALAACAGVPGASPQTDAQTPAAAVPGDQAISADFPYDKSIVEVDGVRLAYVDEGDGPVVLFLHGNPTSSYLWRNIIPYVADDHRAIALDLAGMGDSDQPDIAYSFADHAAYVDGFIAALGLRDVTLVVHDWGSALGMRYARLNPDNVRGLAFMEAIVPPGMPAPNYEAMGDQVGALFRDLRTPGVGEEMVLENNFFVEVVLPELGVVRDLSETEMTAYRAPFPDAQSRRPTLAWPRQLPIAGEPAEVVDVILANGAWLAQTDLPKLYFYGEPGALNPAPVTAWFEENLSNLTSVNIGPGLHFLQEDNPHAIGAALEDWLARLP